MTNNSWSNEIPLVSVLMPVFNAGHYLCAALNSVASQAFRGFELIVVDDGSTDGSTSVLQEFAVRDPRVRLVTRGNLGLIATRNELLQLARGEFVAWMDSDDISLRERLSRQVDTFRVDPALVCLGTAAQCIDPNGRNLNVERYPTTHDEILIEQQKAGATRFPTTMMRRETAIQVGGFREPFKIGEDFDLLLRLSEVGKMANLSEILYLYRQHTSSVCATLGHQWAIYRDQILSLALQRKANGRDQLQLGEALEIDAGTAVKQNALAWHAYIRWAGCAIDNQDWALALKYSGAAIVQRPLNVRAWRLIVRVLWMFLLDVITAVAGRPA